MRIIRTGCTRIVILVFGYAVKIPNFLNGWRLLLKGLLANMQEYDFSKGDWHNGKLCPVIFYIPGGLVTIMPQAQEISREEFLKIPADWKYVTGLKSNETDTYEGTIPMEWKQDGFGWLNGRLVVIDYGN